ncbi:MAG: protein translocase subunit SecF, partial [Clostridia bacterium]|nr:protein translocase subunit SecF [Clostridia bacterium]
MFKNIDFSKTFKFILIAYAVFFVIGAVFAFVWGGVNLSIDFKGGTRISYSYEGDVDFDAVGAKVQTAIGKDVII